MRTREDLVQLLAAWVDRLEPLIRHSDMAALETLYDDMADVLLEEEGIA